MPKTNSNIDQLKNVILVVVLRQPECRIIQYFKLGTVKIFLPTLFQLNSNRTQHIQQWRIGRGDLNQRNNLECVSGYSGQNLRGFLFILS